MHDQISRLFKDDPDLRSDFKVFMPAKSRSKYEDLDDMAYDAPASERRSGRTSTPILDKTVNSKRKDKSDLPPPTVPQKRKRKIDMDKGKEILSSSGKGAAANKVR